MGDFSIADLSDEDYEHNKGLAKVQLDLIMEPPSFSKGICGSITAGYGRCDSYGYFEFPLQVDQDTLEVSSYDVGVG